MNCSNIVISSGHGLKVRGASSDICDEVDEARIVTEALADALRLRGVDVTTFHDDVSTSQDENLNRIVDFHNAQGPHDLDVSVHFNAYTRTQAPMGTEVLFYSDGALASELSAAIAEVGLINRGGKQRQDLFFLSQSIEKAVLLEICFCDSDTDVMIYRQQFERIIDNLAFALSGVHEAEGPGRPERPDRPDQPDQPPPDDGVLFHAVGMCSHFGGPDDTGVSESEGLAFIHSITEENQHLFLPIDQGTGLARRLNAKAVNYIACRWDYDVTPKTMLAESGERALVRSLDSGREALAWPADWGPNEATHRVADLSPALCEVLGVETDDEVEVIYPWREA